MTFSKEGCSESSFSSYYSILYLKKIQKKLELEKGTVLHVHSMEFIIQGGQAFLLGNLSTGKKRHILLLFLHPECIYFKFTFVLGVSLLEIHIKTSNMPVMTLFIMGQLVFESIVNIVLTLTR